MKFFRDHAVKGNRGSIDNIYGPHLDNDKLMLGDKPLTFDNDGAINVSGTRYAPTEGLYELLFKKAPIAERYTENDLDAYKDMLIKSNGHKTDWKHDGKIRRLGSSQKYRQIITRLFPPNLYGGKGTITKSLNVNDYTYWDDPNELCERLGLLVTSAESGNTGHKNEIINIVEELREANVIKGGGNSRFHSLLK